MTPFKRPQNTRGKPMLTIQEQGMIVIYVREHISERISLGTLADLLGMSQRYLGALFKSSFAGWTVHRYVLNARVENAARLLSLNCELLVNDVARLSGFCSPSHLGNIFLLHKGLTPTEYRKWYLVNNGQ